jgi:hypothetical protein
LVSVTSIASSTSVGVVPAKSNDLLPVAELAARRAPLASVWSDHLIATVFVPAAGEGAEL